MYFGENTHQHASRDVGVEGGIARAAQGKAGQEFLCPFGRRAKPAQQFREHASEVGVPILPVMLFPPPPLASFPPKFLPFPSFFREERTFVFLNENAFRS